ncbi:MAG: hypothetical protein ABL973_08795 [Micropepsaceae bacterium]
MTRQTTKADLASTISKISQAAIQRRKQFDAESSRLLPHRIEASQIVTPEILFVTQPQPKFWNIFSRVREYRKAQEIAATLGRVAKTHKPELWD